MVLKYCDIGNATELVDCANAQTIGGVKFFNDPPGVQLTANSLLALDNSSYMFTPAYIVINETADVGAAAPNLGVSVTQDGGAAYGNIRNLSNTADSSAKFDVRVGGSSAGDPFFAMDIDGVGGWSIGLDNSDDDKFKIDRGAPASPGSGTYLSIDTSGTVLIPDLNATDLFVDTSLLLDFITPSQLLSTDGSGYVTNPSYIQINETSTPGFGIGNLYVVKTEDAGTVMITAKNESNTADSMARIDITVGGGSAGDPYLNLDIGGVGGWSVGVDNSDDDKFKIDHGGPGMPGLNTYLSIDYTTGDIVDHQGHLSISTAGKTLKVAQGSNACMGTGAVLVGGTVTVSTTAVNTGDMVITSCTAAGGTQGIITVSIVDATSFTLTSSSGSDTSTYSWLIVKAA